MLERDRKSLAILTLTIPILIAHLVNEMLKASNDVMLLAYVKLFNIILDTGHIPDNWTIVIIKPISKNKGSKNDTDNNRNCSHKLFG